MSAVLLVVPSRRGPLRDQPESYLRDYHDARKDSHRDPDGQLSNKQYRKDA